MSPFVLRQVHSDEVLTHWRALSSQARAARFGALVHGAFLQALAASFCARPGQAIGLFWEGQLAVLGELRPSSDAGPTRCEFAISVLDVFQRRGLGRRVMIALCAEAQRHGYAEGEFWVDRSNLPMIGLCRSLNATATWQDGALRYVLQLPTAGAPATRLAA